jgi:DNA polymerase zeta
MKPSGKKKRPGDGQKSLLEIHSEFDTIHCLVTMLIEPIVLTKEGKNPNPIKDEIQAIWMIIEDERAKFDLDEDYKTLKIIILNSDIKDSVLNNTGIMIGMQERVLLKIFSKEIDVIQNVIDTVHYYNPDILMAYEMLNMSIGFIQNRWKYIYNLNFLESISRCPKSKFMKLNREEYIFQYHKNKDVFPEDYIESMKKRYYYFDLKVEGRVLYNVSDNMSLNLEHLKDYDIDRIAFELLQKREPVYSFDTLTKTYKKGYPSRLKVFEHTFKQMELAYKFMETLDLVNRDITMAKTYGIDLHSVGARGSQYKVESLLTRLARSNQFLLLSASMDQVRHQDTQEVIPFVKEPEREFHLDPISVLDFQSLYPSIIISHNICYSTCLGKVIKKGDKFGVYKLTSSIKRFFNFPEDKKLTSEQEKYIMDNIIVSPNLVVFVKPNIRKGLLPQMLSEILNTRIMIKQSMKLYGKKSLDYRILDSRQYALKMVANVTYGYTAAGFSGRMPWVEIADAIVGFARMSLEATIEFTESEEWYQKIMKGTWMPKVTYGDTDSLFVKFPGLTVARAYECSQRLIQYITESNPYPMELKYEKVYLPMINLAKKRYCGYKYETPSTPPEVESKGIETIRRDFLPLTTKIMNKLIHILFMYNDLSLAKKYIENQAKKILEGNVEFADIFLKREKDKNPLECYKTETKDVLLKKALRELINPINRVMHIFGEDITTWIDQLKFKNSSQISHSNRGNLQLIHRNNVQNQVLSPHH